MKTRRFRGFFRGLAWDREDSLMVVGNKGQVLKIRNGRSATLSSGTRHDLRAVSVNSSNGTSIVVGNAGTALLIDKSENVMKIDLPTFENLRAVSWNPNGSIALVAGNNGALYKYSAAGIETIDAGRANIRDISWHPKSNSALLASNCFAEEFVPSPNLFSYQGETSVIQPLNEGRVDLIGAAWKPTGSFAVVVGYDVVWHNGFIGKFDGSVLLPQQSETKGIYPVAVAWKASGDIAAIVTATGQEGVGKGTIFLWDEKSLKTIYADRTFFFNDVAWNWRSEEFAALASTQTRTFNA